MPGQFDQKKRPGARQEKGPGADLEQEQEQEAEQELQPEHARLQGQVGNQAMLAMLGHGASDGGGGGVELEPSARRRKTGEKETPEHGGEDDPVDPGPLTIEDLAETWNPGTRRTEDRPIFQEAMPDDDLPPEDEAWLSSTRTLPDPWELPPATSWHLDALLQPSPEAVRVSMTAWARAASHLAPRSLVWQLLARLVVPPAPVLQDPHGRVLLSRSRCAAIGSALLLASPCLVALPGRQAGSLAVTCAAVDFVLELAARAHRIQEVRIDAEVSSQRSLPVALELFDGRASTEGGPSEPRVPSPGLGRFIGLVIDDLLAFEDPALLIPDLARADPVEEDDPLGLDLVLAEFTGGEPDPEVALSEAAVQAAERLAGAAARSRVHAAGTALALAEVAGSWSSGAPNGSLRRLLGAYDREVASTLQLLVEVARAAQRRSVPPRGLRAGLRRAARALARAQDSLREELACVVCGVLPAVADLALPEGGLPPAVVAAYDEGRPSDAARAIRALAPSPEGDLAAALALAVAGRPVSELAPALGAAAPPADPLAALALRVVLGAAALADGDVEGALAAARRLLDEGRRRRNGIWIAEGALLTVEASPDRPAAEQVRRKAANATWRLGAHGAHSLLARWTPPTPD